MNNEMKPTDLPYTYSTKKGCARLIFGKCMRPDCLHRGGWKPGTPVTSFDVATCEEYEASLIGGPVRKKRKNMKKKRTR